MLPTQILDKLCKEIHLSEPVYGPGVVSVDDKEFYASETVINEAGKIFFQISVRCCCNLLNVGRRPKTINM